MDLSNLKMTLKAYQKISKSVLSQFVTRPELDDAINNTKVEFDAKLEGYVEEIPVEFKDNGKTYEVVNPQEVLEVLIAVPRFRRKYYFRIK